MDANQEVKCLDAKAKFKTSSTTTKTADRKAKAKFVKGRKLSPAQEFHRRFHSVEAIAKLGQS